MPRRNEKKTVENKTKNILLFFVVRRLFFLSLFVYHFGFTHANTHIILFNSTWFYWNERRQKTWIWTEAIQIFFPKKKFALHFLRSFCLHQTYFDIKSHGPIKNCAAFQGFFTEPIKQDMRDGLSFSTVTQTQFSKILRIKNKKSWFNKYRIDILAKCTLFRHLTRNVHFVAIISSSLLSANERERTEKWNLILFL